LAILNRQLSTGPSVLGFVTGHFDSFNFQNNNGLVPIVLNKMRPLWNAVRSLTEKKVKRIVRFHELDTRESFDFPLPISYELVLSYAHKSRSVFRSHIFGSIYLVINVW